MNVAAEISRVFFNPSRQTYRLIGVNAFVFITISLLGVIGFLFQLQYRPGHIIADDFLSVPADLRNLLYKPWTLVTYMFTHKAFFHILFNMLWLYFFGQLFEEYLGGKKLNYLYFLGGIAGAVLYIFAFNVFPVFKTDLAIAVALGASASVMAIVVATATLLPDYSVSLILIGPVKIKYIAIITVLIDLLSIGSGNAGGHIAHLGGALYGFVYIKQLNNGRDLSLVFQKMYDGTASYFSIKNKLKVAHKADSNSKSKDLNVEQHIVDSILDKISKSGYESLTKEEKNLLFKSSNSGQP